MALTYKEFLEKDLDLAPLGVERNASFERYFCTPLGAVIIGSSGVDGIHFCMINDFGEMVFAVSPLNGVGSYVHPIAENFADFLSLLVTVGGSDAIEQAWMCSPETFDRFLRENPPTEEQKKTIQQLRHDLSVPLMDHPFAYIQRLQASFDASKIKFTDEYYDVVGEKPDVPAEPQGFSVDFGGGFRKARSEKTRPCRELVFDYKFVWGDEIWHIPALYLFAEGVVIDYCIEIQPQKVKAFLDKWLDSLEDNSISNALRQQIDSENPLEVDFLARYVMNADEIRLKNGFSISYIPDACLPEGVENSEKALAVIDHYHLDPLKAWSFHRHSCLGATVKESEQIRSFAVRLQRRPVCVPGFRFQNPSVGDVICFTHPVSGIAYQLTVVSYEEQKLSDQIFSQPGYDYPTCYTQMQYTLTPPLPEEEYTVRDCQENKPVRRTSKMLYEPESVNEACLGIIGGADGPTAILLSPKDQKKNFHEALSSLRFAPATQITWEVDFWVKTMADKELSLL